jgi:hypothetical protein
MARAKPADALPLGQRPGGLLRPRGKGFPSGAANPRVKDIAERKARKAAKAAAKAAARTALLQRFHPHGIPAFTGAAKTQPLTEREWALLKFRMAQAAPPSLPELAAELGRCETTVRRALKRLQEPAPDAAVQQRKRGGRPRLLTPAHVAILRAALASNPAGGVRDAAKTLHLQCGVRAAASTIARALRR